MSLSFFLTLSSYITVALLLHEDVNIIVSEPYMDEIFHVPQCEKFCRGNFSYWDPKITTLPGSYISTVSILGLLNYALPYDICNVFWMRSISLLFSFGNLYLIYQIIGIRWKGIKTLNHVLAALSISTFPVLYFFSFLYYTDVFSIFFLLLAYKSHLQSMNKDNFDQPLPWAIVVCQLAGAMSVFVRQTNIVWINYICVDQGLAYFCRFVVSPQAQRLAESKNLAKSSTKKARKRRNSAGAINDQKIREDSLAKKYPKMAEIFISAQRKLKCEEPDPGYFNFFMIFSGSRFTGFFFVNVLFGCFIMWNGGIAVGDRTAHQVSLNFPQIFYFLLFTAIMAFPMIFVHILRVIRNISFNRSIFINSMIVICIFIMIIHVNTVAHPYLLADNRHYTFYVWKRLFEWFPLVRYALAPVYFFMLYIVLEMFDIKYTGNLCGNVVYFLFCVLNLVPQQLLEFRYFIPGYLIFRLNIGEYRKRFILLELLWYCALNGATFYMFLHKPFLWPTSSESQRFMW